MKKLFYHYTFVSITFIAAYILTIIPLGNEIQWLRPEWVPLVLIYWVVFLPASIGILTGFIAGLVMDLLNGMLFGTMGLTLAIVAYLAHSFRTKVRVFSFWRQLIIVLVLVGFNQLIRLWIQLLVGHPPLNLLYWASTVMSAVAWPFVFLILQRYQKTLKLT